MTMIVPITLYFAIWGHVFCQNSHGQNWAGCFPVWPMDMLGRKPIQQVIVTKTNQSPLFIKGHTTVWLRDPFCNQAVKIMGAANFHHCRRHAWLIAPLFTSFASLESLHILYITLYTVKYYWVPFHFNSHFAIQFNAFVYYLLFSHVFWSTITWLLTQGR